MTALRRPSYLRRTGIRWRSVYSETTIGNCMQNFLKNAARAGHSVIAKYPRLAYIYILIVSTISRNFLGPHLSPRVRNLLVGHGVEWPQLTLPARHTTVGARTEILLIPHLGEFDQEVLFYKRLPLRIVSILLAGAIIRSQPIALHARRSLPRMHLR